MNPWDDNRTWKQKTENLINKLGDEVNAELSKPNPDPGIISSKTVHLVYFESAREDFQYFPILIQIFENQITNEETRNFAYEALYRVLQSAHAVGAHGVIPPRALHEGMNSQAAMMRARRKPKKSKSDAIVIEAIRGKKGSVKMLLPIANKALEAAGQKGISNSTLSRIKKRASFLKSDKKISTTL